MRAIRPVSALLTGVLITLTPAAVTAQSPEPSPMIIKAPTAFTAHSECGPQVADATITRVTGQTQDGDPVVRTERRGDAWDIVWEVSDPRLAGTLILTSSEDSYALEGTSGGPTVINRETLRIENEDGAWEGTGLGFGLGDASNESPRRLLTGEGAYEGLSAFLYQITSPEEVGRTCAADHRGLVFEQAPPTER
jgi:hypothetical protein